MPLVFPPFSGDQCPKCGGSFGVAWHPKATTPPFQPGPGEMNTCHTVEGWPIILDQPVMTEDWENGGEEHLHRLCVRCDYERIEALATEEQRQAQRAYEYQTVFTLTEVNEATGEGWRVTGCFTDNYNREVYLMERRHD